MNKLSLLTLLLLISCDGFFRVETSSPGYIVSDEELIHICSTVVVNGKRGKAICENPDYLTPINNEISVLASKTKDLELPHDGSGHFLPVALDERTAPTLREAFRNEEEFLNNYSVIPNPLIDNDGINASASPSSVTDPTIKRDLPARKYYLETIAANITGATRSTLVICGTTGTVEDRIADCKNQNGVWAFYDGKKYGQAGEGDWSLVSVNLVSTVKYEVWRDERTKLLWSDSSTSQYNVAQASGYSTPREISFTHYQMRTDPGMGWIWAGTYTVIQPASPISVCPDVDSSGAIAAGGGSYSVYNLYQPQQAIKGGLNLLNTKIMWKVPSRADYMIADVNGIRKVLPNLDGRLFYSTTKRSNSRYYSWMFNGTTGELVESDLPRVTRDYVRCVGYVLEEL